MPREAVHDVTLYVLAGMLVAGFICNYLVRPLADNRFMSEAEVAALQKSQRPMTGPSGSMGIGEWRLNATLKNALVLFR